MRYTIFYKPSAVKELECLPREVQRRVIEAVQKLGEGDFYKVEKLTGHENFYRNKRVWPYRILFAMEGKVIRITTVVHRQGAYK